MRETTRRKAIETALDPMRRHPTAQAVLDDYTRHGEVTQPTIDRLLARADGASSGERTLLDLVAVLLDFTADQTPHAHPARAFRLGDRFYRAYVGALAIVATGGADPLDQPARVMSGWPSSVVPGAVVGPRPTTEVPA